MPGYRHFGMPATLRFCYTNTCFMKLLPFLLLVICTTVALPAVAQGSTDTIKVAGECGMCKQRIQKALKTEGIVSAVWNADTKQLTVTYNPAVITNDDIQKKVAAAGHDTEKYAAPDDVYEKLPACCLYERKKDNKHHSSHNHRS